jgi:hypothetical protein
MTKDTKDGKTYWEWIRRRFAVARHDFGELSRVATNAREDKKPKVAKFWLLCLALAYGLVHSLYSDSAGADLHPDPKLSPLDVVEFQLAALRANDVPTADAGIERTFRFASPENKAAVGSLEHFTGIVHGPQYSSLINAAESSVIKVAIQDAKAHVLARVMSASGSEVFYVFILSKQTQGDYMNCWMTDGVLPVEETEKSDEPGTAI